MTCEVLHELVIDECVKDLGNDGEERYGSVEAG